MSMHGYGAFTLLLLAAVSGAGGEDPPPPKLTPAAFWSFNDCPWLVREEGMTADLPAAVLLRRARDVSPQANHLTLRGARCDSGKYGLGLRFDGIDDRAETAAGVLNFDDSLTISAWVYPERLEGPQNIVNKWYYLDSYMLGMDWGDFVFSVAFEDGGPVGTGYSVRAPAKGRKWTHVAGVFDQSTHSIKLYVDGIFRKAEPTPDQPLQPSDRPVVVGNNPDWNALRGRIDEVGLYHAALSSDQIRTLAARPRSAFHGADTTVSFEDEHFPKGRDYGYDFFAGRLGKGRNSTCRLRDEHDADVLTWKRDLPPCCPTIDGCSKPKDAEMCQCLFEYEAAVIARPERTYGYWWMYGPLKRGSRSPFNHGFFQAEELIKQRRLYSHLVGGETLFADVELSIEKPDSSGWEVCIDSLLVKHPAACDRNRDVLTGFLQAVADAGLVPGVYTRPENWVRFFGPDWAPAKQDGSGRLPFVLWLAGCATTQKDGKRTSRAVEQDLQIVKETALGGMQAVLWQHHIEDPDYDVARRNPSGRLTPIRVPPGNAPYACTCDEVLNPETDEPYYCPPLPGPP